ncbi:MAG: polysaccharide biosynthesis/export family protein, partial [Acetobacteraceae bacterium]
MRFRTAFRLVPTVLAAALVAGCANGSGAAAAAAARAAPAHQSEYVIGPGDTLSIFVYQSPQLSVSSLPVRPDGRISIPLVPDIVAAGRTPTQLSHDIAAKLAKYVKHPNVTVIVNSFSGLPSRQIRVVGEATEPMSIPYREHMTLLDVLVDIKGLTRFAAGNSAVVVRREGRGPGPVHANLAFVEPLAGTVGALPEPRAGSGSP